jgi:hypothetical protein
MSARSVVRVACHVVYVFLSLLMGPGLLMLVFGHLMHDHTMVVPASGLVVMLLIAFEALRWLEHKAKS